MTGCASGSRLAVHRPDVGPGWFEVEFVRNVESEGPLEADVALCHRLEVHAFTRLVGLIEASAKHAAPETAALMRRCNGKQLNVCVRMIGVGSAEGPKAGSEICHPFRADEGSQQPAHRRQIGERRSFAIASRQTEAATMVPSSSIVSTRAAAA